MVTCAGNTDIDKIILHVYVRCFNKPLDSLVNVNDAAVSRKSRWHGQACRVLVTVLEVTVVVTC